MDKIDILRKMGALNKNPLKVTHKLFIDGGQFFDPHDKLQVKYEMLRAVQIDGFSITQVAKAFGYSRETYYTVARDFELEGCVGLLDQSQGRRQPVKLQTEIVEFIFSERYKDPENNSGYRLVEKIYDRFHVKIHPRTIYKVLKKLK
jgi:transposase